VHQGYDVVVVGGGTAGCVLAARLSEESGRSVCLLEAGPDYGPLADGRWPPELLDARRLAFSHDWGTGGEDARSLGARVLGGCSAHNACMALCGTPADYDEWGPDWSHDRFGPYLERARAELRTAPANTDDPPPFHAAFLEAAQAAGFTRLADPDDPSTPVGVASFPANVVGGTRWSTAFAYLDAARNRPNLEIVDRALVDRVLVEGGRARATLTADGRRFDAVVVVLAAGAYFTPAILIRSGIGPEAELERLGLAVESPLPVGERLLDHCGTGIAWDPAERLAEATAAQAEAGGLFEPHLVLKAASGSCPPGTWDLHLLPWVSPAPEGGHEVSAAAFHMKPLSTGRLRVRTTDPAELPLVERGFLSREEDVAPIVEGLELAREIAATAPLDGLLATELRPGWVPLDRYLRENVRNYFHPAGTCPLGSAVDASGRVLGVEGLVVADASIMPTIPRANPNLTTVAIAERLAELI
jgi:choline dehydrogenase